jgi:hypothetical protein
MGSRGVAGRKVLMVILTISTFFPDISQKHMELFFYSPILLVIEDTIQHRAVLYLP